MALYKMYRNSIQNVNYDLDDNGTSDDLTPNTEGVEF